MEIPKERLLIIKSYNRGMSLREIGEILDIHYRKAHYWIQRYNELGNEGLKTRKQPGKKPLLGKGDRKKLQLFLINNKPKRYNGNAVGWNSRKVKIYIKQEFNISYSLRHIERLLHKLGFSLIVLRPKNVKAFSEKQELFKQNFKKNLKQNIWVCR